MIVSHQTFQRIDESLDDYNRMHHWHRYPSGMCVDIHSSILAFIHPIISYSGIKIPTVTPRKMHPGV
jgi:hypothetical protein